MTDDSQRRYGRRRTDGGSLLDRGLLASPRRFDWLMIVLMLAVAIGVGLLGLVYLAELRTEIDDLQQGITRIQQHASP